MATGVVATSLGWYECLYGGPYAVPRVNFHQMAENYEWYERAVGPAAAPDLAAYYAHWEDFWTERVFSSQWFTSW